MWVNELTYVKCSVDDLLYMKCPVSNKRQTLKKQNTISEHTLSWAVSIPLMNEPRNRRVRALNPCSAAPRGMGTSYLNSLTTYSLPQRLLLGLNERQLSAGHRAASAHLFPTLASGTERCKVGWVTSSSLTRLP